MSYIHVLVEMKNSGNSKAKSKGKTKIYIESDCANEDEVLEDIIIPYVSNSTRILIEGAFISAVDIEKMTVVKSNEDSKQLYAKASAEIEARASRMAFQGVLMGGFGVSMYGAIIQMGEDITTEIIRKAMKMSK
ncbi:hypothetical protein [Klebsiella pneumoniae]|uniref:hypothetical protein n=1 Tax=Klebsiella pneumoniae TaxID=573 RepID=UPI003B3E47E3|nr:hypothetical protein [Klebsiella quasipneumoniae]